MNDEKNLLINDDKWLELASEYIEGALPSEMHEKVRVYLESNPKAQKEEQELRGILQDLGTLPEVDPPMFFRENLMKALEAQQEAARQKKPWWHLTPFVQRSLMAGGAFAALALGFLLPQLRQEPSSTVKESGVGGTQPLRLPTIINGVTLPESKPSEPAHLSVAHGMVRESEEGRAGRAYEFTLKLTNSPRSRVRIEVPGREPQIAILKENIAQAVRVEPDATQPVLSLGIRWTAEGGSQEKQFYVPTQPGNTIPWRNPGEGSTLDRVLTNLVAYYGKPVTVENVDIQKIQLPTLVPAQSLQETLAARLAPLGLQVISSNDGVIITRIAK
jgi:hypothetical protein